MLCPRGVSEALVAGCGALLMIVLGVVSITWSIFPFIGAMFVLVRGVENLGLTRMFGALLIRLGGHSALGAIVATTEYFKLGLTVDLPATRMK